MLKAKSLEDCLKKIDRQERTIRRDIQCMERCLAEWNSKLGAIKKQRGLILEENPLTPSDEGVK